MYVRLSFLICWALREVMDQNMPPVIKQLYPSCRCIIDCSEVFIAQQTLQRSCTIVLTLHHPIVKFLIGISPCGPISHLSQTWGGRDISDEYLRHFEPGDTFLADCGLTNIADDIVIHGAMLKIPAFYSW